MPLAFEVPAPSKKARPGAPNVKKLLSIPPSIDADMRLVVHALASMILTHSSLPPLLTRLHLLKQITRVSTTISCVFPNLNPKRKELKNDDNKNKNRFNGRSYI